jgi:hypothetical protein
VKVGRSLGYGTYQFTVDSRLDTLDPNVALGLFTWSDDPAENHREVDIEFARFGQPTAPVGRYTLQPYTSDGNVFLFAQPDSLESTPSFGWTRAEHLAMVGPLRSSCATLRLRLCPEARICGYR